MAETFICGGALAAPLGVARGGDGLRWPDLATVLTPSASAGSMSVAALQAAASGVLAGATHLSLHGAAPGATGANEITESRVDIAIASVGGCERVDGATSTGTVAATHWGAWVVA